MRVGVLTGGGDCPGLNPAIKGVVQRGADHGFEFVGIELGWRGLIENFTLELNLERVEDIHRVGGTILGSSRTNPFAEGQEDDLRACLRHWDEIGLDALIAIGGEDTLGVANRLHCEHAKNVVGVPKTMDNDLDCTDYTFGFWSAVNVAVDAADRLTDTARSHHRILVLEVMGRHAGWVALYTGIAAGADYICIPEVPVDLDDLVDALKRKRARGKRWGLVVTSEGAEIPAVGTTEEESLDAFGHATLAGRNVGEFLATVIEERTNIETRSVSLGHVVRGGAPTPFDRLLGLQVGILAADLVHEGKFGMMAALHGTEIVPVPLADAVARLKTVPLELYESLRTTFND